MYRSIALALGVAFFSNVAAAQDGTYEVTVTNLTPGQSFTPLLVMTHTSGVRMFRLGQPASDALELMAEGGDTSGLMEQAGDRLTDSGSNGALLGPGETTTITVTGTPGTDRLSLAGMLLPTNDNFVALRGKALPSSGSRMFMAPAYDAGTEVNDQSCQHIPGPRCGGEAISAEGGEGVVHIGNGFHDLGDEDADGFEVLWPDGV